MVTTIFVNTEKSVSEKSLVELFNNTHHYSTDQFNELPEDFEANISVWHLQKSFKSYGHWTLELELEINGKKLEVKTITTNSELIDDWNNEDDGLDYNPKLAAIEDIVNDCEHEIIEFIIDNFINVE